MKDGAPLVHGDVLHTNSMGETSAEPSNVAAYMRFEKGDVETGVCRRPAWWWSGSLRRLRYTRDTLNPTTPRPFWNSGTGSLTIWCSTQGSFVVRANTADALRHPVSKIKVVPMEIGGGFGGKVTFYLEPVAALLSQKTGQPVKLLMSRTEVFEGSGPAPGTWMKVKVGATGRR